MQTELTKEVLRLIRNTAFKKDISLSEFGENAGVSKAWISKLQHTDANLSLDTAQGLLNASGYELKIVRK